MKQFPTITTDDRDLSMIQDRIVSSLNPLLALPLSNSNFLEGIDLITGENEINHGLGRPLQGWIVVRKDADESMYDEQLSNPSQSKTLILVSSGDVEISLIVF